MNHKFNNSIFRAYDIRGIYNETLFDNDAYFIGKAFASYLIANNKKNVAIACDGRLSSPILKERLIQGLKFSGLNVFDIGIGPTPMLYFSVYHLECHAGIMVTGSHNPSHHNGFKFMVKDVDFFGDDILNLSKIAEFGKFYEGEGELKEVNVKQVYVNRILSECSLQKSESELLDEVDELIKPIKKIKIAWDAGNGSAGEVMTMLTQRINAEHILLFNDIDGNFPNHHPDPTVEKNLQDLIKVVKENNCDLGVAFDGDGDRIGVVDGQGEIIWGDQLMILFSRDILSENPNQKIIADVKASNILFDEIKKAGGQPIMWKTGHSLIKAKMRESKSILAGEMSGHIFFADKYYGFDDGLYSAIRLIEIVFKSDQSLSEMRKQIPKTYFTSEIRIECLEEEKFQIIKKIKQDLISSNHNFNDIDGIRVNEEFGWWLIRASNTQSALVARCEADSVENLKKLKLKLQQNLKFYNIKIPHELE